MAPKLLVFDLDDTLYPERDFVLSGFRAVDEWVNARGLASSFGSVATRLFESGRRGTVFDEALQQLGIPLNPGLVAELVEVYRNHSPKLRLFADADWALGHFRPAHKLAIITDGYLATQKNKVAALGLLERTDLIICTDGLGREHWKPSPRAYRIVEELFGCTGKECVYIGDNPGKDFIAPNRLGWMTVRIRRPDGEHASAEALPGSEPAKELVDLRGLAGMEA